MEFYFSAWFPFTVTFWASLVMVKPRAFHFHINMSISDAFPEECTG